MRKIFGIIGFVFLAVVLAAVAVFFVFEKDIPKDIVKTQIEAIQNYKLDAVENIDDIPNGTINYTYEKLTYTKEGDKTITTIDTKYEYSFKKSGTGDALKIELELVTYTNNGQTKTTARIKYYKENEIYYQVVDNEDPTEVDPYSAVIGYGILLNELFEGTTEITIKASILDMIENNLTKVSQKGLTIKLHLEKDNVLGQLSYNYVSGKVSAYKQVKNTYDTSNALVAKETSYISF